MLLFSFLFFTKLFYFSFQQEINYTINSSSILIDYCNLEEGIILFHINGKIYPDPYCNIEFDLSLSNPLFNDAECVIYDDINNRINCSLMTRNKIDGEVKIKKQFIILDKYRASVNLLDFPNNSININCNVMYINKKNILFLFYFLLFLLMYI